ncbi:MAG TPA: SDR family NAD(P)-dependent oxidoreductase [Solirubrobacterales bacterium]|jgi:3-oxoacyl-[acyl-carrier protein] reductase
MNRYADQVAIVTGAARGLGLAMARRFAAEGANVVIADVDGVALEALSSEFEETAEPKIRRDVIDVTSSQEVRRWIDGIGEEYGRVDVLVNNAGIIRDNRVEKVSDEDWRQVIGVNLFGAFNCIRSVLPLMRDRGYGRILSFSSMSWRGNYGQANYSAAKAGVVGLTSTVALEAARDGITVNVIAPGLIETPMLASMDSAARAKLIARVPMRHTGDPGDVAAAAAFLCSPEAGYLTGVVLNVDGGISVGSASR